MDSITSTYYLPVVWRTCDLGINQCRLRRIVVAACRGRHCRGRVLDQCQAVVGGQWQVDVGRRSVHDVPDPQPHAHRGPDGVGQKCGLKSAEGIVCLEMTQNSQCGVTWETFPSLTPSFVSFPVSPVAKLHIDLIPNPTVPGT